MGNYCLRLFGLTGGVWSTTMAVLTAADGAWLLSAAFAVVASAFFVSFLLIDGRNDEG